MVFIFYLISFIFFAPMGVYSLLKNKMNSSVLQVLFLTVFGVKSLVDFSFYYMAIKSFEGAGGYIMCIASLVITICLYRYAIVKKMDLKTFATLGIESKKSMPLKPEELDAYNYLNTGEIYSFNYKGAEDTSYQTRNIIVNKIYKRNKYIYIDGLDVDIDESRTFRADRIL
ncbi:hypothetical protein [Fusobacterium ulcerans]|uniref:hypothetical protein n=1 Tax=Fusobacterium ulcerans TaxID=861 RepID=UPI0026DD695C|nr:hypothetical protein [Fusobacterium ulcerans]